MPQPPADDPERTRLLHADEATVLLPAHDQEATRLLTRLRAQEIPIALPPGYRLHEYRIDSVLGQGGFGITYLASDVNLRSKVAIKEYLPAELAQREAGHTVRPRSADREALFRHGRERFLFEARTLATFRHPNIVRVARFFEANATAYMVLDYERGLSLKAWWARHASRSSEAELLRLLRPLLDGLALVHQSGVLHRDIKPDNLCVRQQDGSLVLLDFGAAQHSDSDSEPDGADNAGAIAVTPGYAPIEQYLGQNQGPWTDLYALGATLYYLVTGRAPREAPDRLAAPAGDRSAVEVGAGRYSEGFLAAIDWALAVRAADRPQSVAALRPRLFATHAGSLGLQEALAVHDGRAATDAKDLRGLGRQHLRRHLWRPASWPLALKMSLMLVCAALLPILLTGYANYRGAVAISAAAELRNLSHLAANVAGRVALLLEASRRHSVLAASHPETAAVLAGADASTRATLRAALARQLAANPDLELLMLLDLQGNALVATDPAVEGRNFAFRDYFRSARAGSPYTSGVALGAVSGKPGVFFAQPVMARGGIVLGVAVVRQGTEAIAAIIDSAQGPGRTPFLIDTDGVLIQHPDARFLYRSLDTLAPQRLADIRQDQRFGRREIASLGMPSLARAMIGALSEGNVSYHSALSGEEEVAGYAPVAGHNWVVGVSESHASFVQPLQRLFHQVLISLGVLAAVFALLAWWFARSIVRPVRALTQSADALKRGDFAKAGVTVLAQDEIGELARTFNVMIDVLREREREHSRGARAPD